MKRRGQSARLVIAITTPNRPTRVRGSGPRTLGRGNLTEGHRARDGYRKTNPAPPGSHLPHHIGCNTTLSRQRTLRKIEDIPRPFDHTAADCWATCYDARFRRIGVERSIRGPRWTRLAGSGGACRPMRLL